jgi:NADPH-dependent ferric siderophore reductase
MDGQTIQVADLRVSQLPSRTVAALQKDFGVTVVLHQRSTGTAMADLESPIHPGDTLVVAAPGERIHKLEAANRG